ncbi:MAG: hypothetical protein R3272_06660 [Candidatus Promineifilaceae bacterium]|nr:hypothetical protein [Candidatus Promineifilaceae bacterium]
MKRITDLGTEPLSKRQLGWLLIAIGVFGLVLTLSVELMGGGMSSGLGPAQRVALMAAFALAFVGLTLLPLGDRPA